MYIKCTFYVFAINIIENCKWGQWTSRSCTKTCGTGEMVRTRTKTFKERHGGICNGQTRETRLCNTNICTGNAVFFT